MLFRSLVYNIFAACSIYVNLFQYSKTIDKNDRNVDEESKVSTNDFALDECYELLSWSFSLAFSNKKFTEKCSEFRINPKEAIESINQNSNLSLLNSGLPANEDDIHYSIFQSALFQYVISNIYTKNDEKKREKFVSVLSSKSSNYLNLNLMNNFRSEEHTLNSSHPSISRMPSSA